MTTTPTKRAVVVRGGWFGHQPVEATDLFLPHLESNGFEVSVHDSPAVYADGETMSRADLVMQCNTMATIEPNELAGLRAAVAAGTGLAGWHGGIADSYRNSADYLQLIGGQFAHHPGRAVPEELSGEQADNYIPYTVEVTPAAAGHPIMQGIGDFDLTSEQYWVLTDDYNDVLATTTLAARPFDAWNRPITCPAIWTRQWGEGRVFVSTPGHNTDVLSNSTVKTIIERGLLWASR